MIALVVGSLYLGLLFLRAALAWTRAADPVGDDALAPGILTLAQPILGGDPGLRERLAEAIAALPDQRFLWLVDEDDAEGREVTASFRSDSVRIEICPPCPEGWNPKVWKLRRAGELVETPFFGVLDDDTVLPRACAAALCRAAESATVATGLPCYERDGTWPAELLAQFVDNNAIFTYLSTAALFRPFTLNGMGYVMKSEELLRLGGFDPIARELTDDLAWATWVIGRGGEIRQCPEVLLVRTSVEDWGHYERLMHRWYLFSLLLMKRQAPGKKIAIALLHGLPPILLLGAFVAFLVGSGSLVSWMVLASVLVIRHAVLAVVQRKFYGAVYVRPSLSVLSELLQPFHLLHALCRRTIVWRKRRYHVRESNDFTPA